MRRGILVLLIAVAGTLYLSLRPFNSTESAPREKLSSIINSDYQEVRPLISPDGMTLYFSRRNHPENHGGAKDFQDIWVSHYINSDWSEPVNLEAPINNKKTNSLCSITSDGKYALLLDGYKQVKTPLAQAYNSPSGWGPPEDLIIQDFLNISPFYDFYYHEQSKVILIAIDNGRGNGEQDLHVSFRQKNGDYSRPKNLGKLINTKTADFAPFLAADGKTLYFASFGHDGLGGSDFYVSYRLDDSWMKWTVPKNLGSTINSEHDENYLSVTGDFTYVYFESYPTGSVEKDLYRAILPEQFHPQNLAPKIDTQELIVDNSVNQNAFDLTSETDSEFETAAELSPYKESGDPPLLTVSPVYNADPKPADTPDYTPPMDTGENHVEVIGQKPVELFLGSLLTYQYLDQGLLKNKVLNNTYFSRNSYSLSPECISKLDEISDVLRENPGMKAYFEGHADNQGSDQTNLRLSYLRAQAAAHYLIDLGISVQRLQVIATGEALPLASNDDEKEGREFNRRVEVTLIKAAHVYKGYSINYNP